MIGHRIRQARQAAGLTLAALGARIGVTHTAIQKYEKGIITPSSSILLKLAQACGVRTEYFFRLHTVELVNPEFRKLSTFGKTAQEELTIKVIDLVEKRVELLGSFPDSPIPAFELPAGLPEHIENLEQIEAIADQVRNAWMLGMDPIPDVCDTFEACGLLVIVVNNNHPGFSGLKATARTNDGRTYPIIVVSARWPGDRQRFTLAHELAHLLISGRLAYHLDEEKACNRFAGAFLAPAVAVTRLLGQHRDALEWKEIYTLKHEFGLSMAGWLMRAKQCDVITEALYRSMTIRFSAKGWRKLEPEAPVPQENPKLFEQLVYRALGEHCIPESKAAELLGIPMMSFYKQRQLETPDDAPHQ
jgi:Zn-dependent peptidase ImmA (M78 family)/transcriptional regulator with XRE-family HTH domain